MANRGYDVVVDVDAEGDLGHTDLQEDNLEFHSSNFNDSSSRSKPLNAPPGYPPQNTSAPSAGGGKNPFSTKRYLWSLSFYSQFFDVDTSEVLRRCQAAIFPRANFLDVLDGNPDLYGPFWIATTVVVILFFTGTISLYLQHMGEDYFSYDFTLLTGAAALIYGYTAIIPLALWAALKWSGSEAANILECWALYGYANLVWIPVAIISWSPIDVLNYVFVAIGLAISALFLFRNLYPIISTTPHQRAKIILVLVIALHAGLAIAIKILFFAHGSIAAGGDSGGKGKHGGGRNKGPDHTPGDGILTSKPGHAVPTVTMTAPATAAAAAAATMLR